ncbi:MAG: PhoU domain-containing protein [Acidilobaceae archaeon]
MSELREETVRSLLAQLRRYSSAAFDLAVYSLAFNDSVAALEVLLIEDVVDSLTKRLAEKTFQAFRLGGSARMSHGIAGVASALDSISDASGDLATAVLRGYPPHPYITATTCMGEAVFPLRSRREVSWPFSAVVDVLLIKRGEKYLLAPEVSRVMEGDLLVVRGPIDEIEQLSKELGEPINVEKCSQEVALLSRAGDRLAESVRSLKLSLDAMLDMAFYALIDDDMEIASSVVELEDHVDKLYYEALEGIAEHSYSSPSREVISLIVFIKSLEEIGDAAHRLAQVVLKREVSEVLGEAVEMGEEVYLKVAYPKRDPIELGRLDLEDLGFVVVAVYKRSEDDWIVPPRSSMKLEEGDLLLLKYYKTEASAERHLLKRLEAMGLRPLTKTPSRS